MSDGIESAGTSAGVAVEDARADEGEALSHVREGTSAASGPRRWRIGLGSQILLGMLVGAVTGSVLGERASVIEPVGTVFIRLLVLAAVPLVFFNLIAGLTALTDLRALARLALKAVTFFLATTIIAIVFGMAAMAMLRPGSGMALPEATTAETADGPSTAEVLLSLVPENLFQAFAEGNITQLVGLAILLGIATLLLGDRTRDRLKAVFGDLADLFRKVVEIILVAAPIGIGVLMAVTVGRYGAELFGPMTLFFAGVWGAHLAMMAVHMTALKLLSRRRPLTFLRETGPVWATTASTTSSLASLSVAMEVAEAMRLPRHVYAFTLPLGAQVNKDGTAIMLAAIVLFAAQAVGVQLPATGLFTLGLMALLLSAGSGGIPGGGLVVALMLVQSFGLPVELAVVVGGVYRLIDIGNTTVNVMGDLVATAIVADSESPA